MTEQSVMPELDVFNLPVFQVAEFFKGLNEKQGIDGVNTEKGMLLTLDPSEKHDGYWDVSVYQNGECQSLAKPILPIGFKLIPWITDWDKFLFKTRKPSHELRRQHELEAKKTRNCVYFIYAEEINRVKIGYTGDESASYRVESIKTSSPIALRLIGTIQGDMKKEREFHRRFDQQRKHREWFEVSGELLSFINETFGQWR